MTRPADLEAIKQLALMGGLAGDVELSSGEFARLLDASQQTASRRLIELTDDGLVTRQLGVRRQRIRLTERAEAMLRDEHALYERLFKQRDRLHFTGKVVTGLGEGQYYLSRPGYTQPFRRDLGWEPFPGTLNIELDPGEASKLSILKRHPTYAIERFDAEGRTFGGVSYHHADIAGHDCATVLPNRSHYTSVLELIAPQRLRDALVCQDGDRVEVTVRLPEAKA